MKLKGILAAFAALLIVSIVLNAWQASVIRRLERQPHFYGGDRPFIDQAVAMWSKFTGEPITQAMKSRYPQVIALGPEVCVSLSLERGSLGGIPAYCFDETSGHVTRKFENVE